MIHEVEGLLPQAASIIEAEPGQSGRIIVQVAVRELADARARLGTADLPLLRVSGGGDPARPEALGVLEMLARDLGRIVQRGAMI